MAAVSDLSSVIQEFLASRKARGIAGGTIRGERGVLMAFTAAVGNIQVRNITSRHVDMYLAANQHLAPGTWNRNRGYLQGFFKWCRARKYMPRDHDPMEGIGKLKVPPRDFIFIPVERFSEALDSAKNARDRAVAAIGLYSLQRASEITRLTWADVRDTSANPKEWAINVYREKTKTRQALPLAVELKHELDKWRLEYGRLAGQVPRDDWFICPAFKRGRYTNDSATGKLVRVGAPELNPTRRAAKLEHVVQHILRQMGYPVLDHEGAHTLRRSGGRALYEELAWQRGYDGAIRTVQYMFGHKTITTTEHYLRLELEQKRTFAELAGATMFPTRQAKVVSIAQETGRGAGM